MTRKIKLIVELDAAEMAMLVIEGMGGCQRRPGISARQMLELHTPPDISACALMVARSIAEYVQAQMLKGVVPS